VGAMTFQSRLGPVEETSAIGVPAVAETAPPAGLNPKEAGQGGSTSQIVPKLPAWFRSGAMAALHQEEMSPPAFSRKGMGAPHKGEVTTPLYSDEVMAALHQGQMTPPAFGPCHKKKKGFVRELFPDTSTTWVRVFYCILHYLAAYDRKELSPLRSLAKCDERMCGSHISPTGFTEGGADVEILTSQITGAGQGLFLLGAGINEGDFVGYFYGTLRCVSCVKAKKLNKGRSKFNVVECGVLPNASEEEVLWYLYREPGLDNGVCWFINSCRKRNKAGYRVANCELVSQGFGEDMLPIVSCIALKNIAVGEELLLSYMDK
jgi:hypothetical protein